MGSLGLTWTQIDSLGLIWTHLDNWTHLDSLGLTWTHLDSLGLTWTHLDSLGLTWIHLDSLGLTDHDEVSERMARLAFLGKTLGIPVHRQWMATGRLLTEILKLANSLWVSQIIASDEISSQLKRITGQRKRPRRLNTLTQSTGGFAFPQKHPQIAANGIYPIEAYC